MVGGSKERTEGASWECSPTRTTRRRPQEAASHATPAKGWRSTLRRPRAGSKARSGTGGLKIAREDLPKVREQELRSVLKLYGAHPPTMLGYRCPRPTSASS